MNSDTHLWKACVSCAKLYIIFLLFIWMWCICSALCPLLGLLIPFGVHVYPNDPTLHNGKDIREKIKVPIWGFSGDVIRYTHRAVFHCRANNHMFHPAVLIGQPIDANDTDPAPTDWNPPTIFPCHYLSTDFGEAGISVKTRDYIIQNKFPKCRIQ